MTAWRINFVQAALGIALAGLCHGVHLQLMDSHSALAQRKDSHEVLPTAGALRLMSLGYRNWVADYYWLRAVSHFGDSRMHRELYPNLGPLLSRTVALDPLFAGAYVFAGQALTFNGMDYSVPMALLKQGFAARPDDWRIAFFLGFNAYYLMQDYPLATRALSAAAASPQAPPFVAPLAARLSAEAGTPELGITLMDTLLAGTQDPKLHAMYQQRRTLLVLEQQLRDLQRAVNTFSEKNGHAPESLQTLVQANLVDTVPEDPLGGQYRLTGGKVETQHQALRLRLQPSAVLKQKHASD